MDNLTHTLAGLVAAEVLLRRFETSSPNGASRPDKFLGRLRRVVWVIAVVGSNFPDLDVLYGWITPGKLGALLHHRGHTHTLLGGVGISLFLYALFFSWSRRYAVGWSAGEKKLVAMVCCLMPPLHLLLDGLTTRGVHPLWPLWNGWVFGDALFIIDPFLWMVLSLPFLVSAKKLLLRGGFFCVAVAAPLLGWATGFVPPGVCLGLLALWGSSVYRAMRAPSPRVFRTAACVASFYCAFLLVASLAVKMRVTDWLERMSRNIRWDDVALAPRPANPLCWVVNATGYEESSGEYVLQRALYFALPVFSSPSVCGKLPVEGTLALAPISQPGRKQFRVLGEARFSRAEWKRWANKSCSFRAFLRFSRLPFITRAEGAYWVAGDFRMDREKGLGAAEIVLPEHEAECPEFLPPWDPPRASWLTSD